MPFILDRSTMAEQLSLLYSLSLRLCERTFGNTRLNEGFRFPLGLYAYSSRSLLRRRPKFLKTKSHEINLPLSN